MSRSPNGKLEIQIFLTQGPSLSTNLFSFPIPTRVPDHPPVTSSLSHSHTLPDSRVQTSSNRSPPCLTLSLSLTPFSFSLSLFPGKLRNHFLSIWSVLGETKVRIDFQSQALFFFCLMVMIRDKKNDLGMLWIYVYLLGILQLSGLLLAFGYFFRRGSGALVLQSALLLVIYALFDLGMLWSVNLCSVWSCLL